MGFSVRITAMIIDAEQLPSDIRTLRQIIVKLLTENESLKETLIRMRQTRFGSSSEKLNDKQIQLFAELLTDELESASLAEVAADAEFKQWLDQTVLMVGRQSHLYRAIQYALNQWAGLQIYVDHGFLEIDNNAAERSMKPIALGWKNYLFVGSDKGGETAAVLYSILETCKLNQVEPLAYLTDVLRRLPTTSQQELESLLPYHWKAIEQSSSNAA